MRIDVVTLFPGMFEGVLRESIPQVGGEFVGAELAAFRAGTLHLFLDFHDADLTKV